jgi:hypothetical protein
MRPCSLYRSVAQAQNATDPIQSKPSWAHGPEPVEPAAPTADAPPPPVATSASINTAAASTTGDVHGRRCRRPSPTAAPPRTNARPTRTGLVCGQGAAGSEGSDLRRRGRRPAELGAAAPTQNRRRGRGPPTHRTPAARSGDSAAGTGGCG